MTSPDPAETLRQINVAREQSYQNIALTQAQLTLATKAADSAAKDRATIQAIAQQTVGVDTSVGTRVFAGDVMIHGDTGMRVINTLMVAGEALSFAVRRMGDMVTLTMTAWRGWDEATMAPSVTLATLPAGFRPQKAIYTYPLAYRNGNTTLPIYLDLPENGVLKAAKATASPIPSTSPLYFKLVYEAEAQWPSSLPGTPA